MAYKPPPFPAGLRPGSGKPSAKTLQAALKVAGYLSKLVPFSDNYGPATQKAVGKFHDAHPQFRSRPGDPAIGARGWAFLFTKAYAKPEPAEPTHDYSRVSYGGRPVNARTRAMLRQAEAKFGGKISLSQGSYNRGVGASAGTHDGGGVVDISVSSYDAATRNRLLRALREVGFAAWLRTPAEGFSYHVHACAIGDREMAAIAKRQVASYFAGRNGLASNGPDSAPASVGRPYPSWAAKYK